MQEVQTHHHFNFFELSRIHQLDVGRFLLRFSIGGLMLFHGISKTLHGTEMISQLLARVGLPVFFSFGVLVAEIIAPIMLILGFKSRIAGLLIALDMFMAILLVHSQQFFKISAIGGWMLELNGLYFFGALAIAFLGSGKISVSKGEGSWD
ncbi:MAG: DoxX family protein [Bacteriovoracaceae bacterium]